MTKDKEVRVRIRITKEQDDRLKARAKDKGMNKWDYLKSLI
jgi:predicted DNA binding CopG/RHH family protein